MSSILFVCHGNVCRSVYGQLLMRAWLADVGLAVDVASAGVEAGTDLLGCSLVAERAAAVEQTTAGHVPQRLRARDVDAADLILCATVAQRSTVVQLRPEARARAFTLRQAGLLASWDRKQPGWDAVGSAAELATRLRSSRGRVAAPPSAPRRRWGRAVPASDPWDIVDGHHLRPAQHRETLDAIEDAVGELALSFGSTTLLDPRLDPSGSV